MSLKLLAVGQSLAGIRNEKSPYSLRKENRLPTFEGTPRLKQLEKTLIQTDWLQTPARPLPAPEISVQPPAEKIISAAASEPRQPAAPKRRWFSFLKLKWFRTSKPPSDLVQSELSLDRVQPIRNDLADSDLRLVLKRKKAAGADSSPMRAGWSELTAKLFELGQR